MPPICFSVRFHREMRKGGLFRTDGENGYSVPTGAAATVGGSRSGQMGLVDRKINEVMEGQVPPSRWLQVALFQPDRARTESVVIEV